MTRLQASLVLLLVGALWGSGFPVQVIGMETVGPMVFLGLRFLIAAVATWPLAVREARLAPRPLSRHEWGMFLWIGLMVFLGSAAQQVGLLHTSVTNSGFLTGLYVVMVPIFAVLIFRQWPHPVVWPAAFLALMGIWLLSGGTFGALNVGDGLTVLAAAFFAVQLILIARYAAQSRRPIALSVLQSLVGGILGLGAGLLIEEVSLAGLRDAAPELLYAGLVSGALAFTLQAIGQAYVSAPVGALLLASEAIFAAVAGAVMLGERVGALGLAGCGLIFAAIVLVEGWPLLQARRRVSP
ncbi:MAG TPA: DMT family transporter [Mesorhizobium sp.]|jgi:drug/metabolite transporter (DMT)-like permease|nr:DMT family transporter [Mesorhizobium sp.]